MKKSKLIGGILLMILGVGISIGSVVFHCYNHGQYGMINQGHKIVNRHGMMGGYGFRAKPNQNQGQGQNPNPSPIPSQNQNNDQNSNGG
ncbi:hypothetical protein JT05_13290 [Desulfosporosinus sp. Tol-M]|nr:hypothetical protein JT05_13290 [Desulfosporosinus sp. Tol-M]